MRFAHDYLDNQEVKREEYFLLPTSSLLTRLPACSFFNNVFYKGVPNRRKVVRLRATFGIVCIKNHVSHCKKSKWAFYTPFWRQPQQRCFLPDQDAEYTVLSHGADTIIQCAQRAVSPDEKNIEKGLDKSDILCYNKYMQIISCR